MLRFLSLLLLEWHNGKCNPWRQFYGAVPDSMVIIGDRGGHRRTNYHKIHDRRRITSAVNDCHFEWGRKGKGVIGRIWRLALKEFSFGRKDDRWKIGMKCHRNFLLVLVSGPGLFLCLLQSLVEFGVKNSQSDVCHGEWQFHVLN